MARDIACAHGGGVRHARALIRHSYGELPDLARNVTDVDDKIIAAAEAEGVEPE